MRLKHTSTIYFNNMIGNLINFDNDFQKLYSAKLIKDNKIIDIYFIIEKTELYKSYLILKDEYKLFHKNDSKIINIKATDILDTYKLKIYLDNYIVTVPSIKIDSNFCFSIYTTSDTSRLTFDVLNKNKLELFTLERKDDNDINEEKSNEKMDS